MITQRSFEFLQQVVGFCAWRDEQAAATEPVIVRFVTCRYVQPEVEAAVHGSGLNVPQRHSLK
jgi:hypothetical protein